ncbi:MAG: hypothetical protein ACK5MG_02145 [Bacteroidales bacterium]
MKSFKASIILLVLMSTVLVCTAQNAVSLKQVGQENRKPYKYKYWLPFLGKKAADRGFKLPLPHGVMINYMPLSQKVQISDMGVGINDFNINNVQDIVSIDAASVSGYTLNMRLDTWILPFLNVYTLIGYNKSNIEVPLSLNADGALGGVLSGVYNNLENGTYTARSSSTGEYLGLGAMFAGGIGPMFFSWDINHTWTGTDKLDKPARILISGIRTGPIIRIKNKENMNVVLWAGVMYSNLASTTTGRISVNELFPNFNEGKEGALTKMETWYGNLSPMDKIKYAIPYGIVTNTVEGMDGNGEISYHMKKSINHPFNLLLGAQWQINEIWQLRMEQQMLGDRTATLLSLNYRFGLPFKGIKAD